MGTFADWQESARGERQPVEICLDRQAVTDLHLALEEFGSVKQSATGLLDEPEEVQRLAEKVKELDAAVTAQTRTLWFGKIPLHEWSDLEAEHPATDGQKQDNPQARVDPIGFEPAVVARCCIDPQLSLEQARWLRDFLPLDEWNRVVDGVWRANKEGSQVPKGVSGIADRLLSELKSISPAPEESLSPSSADE